MVVCLFPCPRAEFIKHETPLHTRVTKKRTRDITRIPLLKTGNYESGPTKVFIQNDNSKGKATINKRHKLIKMTWKCENDKLARITFQHS